jgi:flagellar FliL protein
MCIRDSSLVTHDPEQLEVTDSLMPVIRNAMVQFFSKRNLEQVRKDLQEIDALQEALRTRLSATISNYGYKAALDDVLVTKVVLQ